MRKLSFQAMPCYRFKEIRNQGNRSLMMTNN